MLDRYDPRDDDRDDSNRGRDLHRGGRERRPVRERDRVYQIDGNESRLLATVGAFRSSPKATSTMAAKAPARVCLTLNESAWYGPLSSARMTAPSS